MSPPTTRFLASTLFKSCFCLALVEQLAACRATHLPVAFFWYVTSLEAAPAALAKIVRDIGLLVNPGSSIY
jgi:hypothetical protein